MTACVTITKYGREVRCGDSIIYGRTSGTVAIALHQATRSHIWLSDGKFIELTRGATVRVAVVPHVTPLVDTRPRIPG